MVKHELNWAAANKQKKKKKMKRKKISLHMRIISIKQPKIACTNLPSNGPLTIYNGLITAHEAATTHKHSQKREKQCMFFSLIFKEKD